MARILDFPVFDADNHLYETKDAFTRYLPDRYRSAIDYVEVRGRTKIVVKGDVTKKFVLKGVLATAGGLVFFGEDSGALMAADARNGAPLWRFEANARWRASPMTYMFDGRQYIALGVGGSTPGQRAS